MAAVTFTIDPDELLGLRALAAVSETAISGAQPEVGADLEADAVRMARLLVNWITGNAAKHPAQHDDLSPDPGAVVLTCAAAPHTTRERGQLLQKGKNDGSPARRHGA